MKQFAITRPRLLAELRNQGNHPTPDDVFFYPSLFAFKCLMWAFVTVLTHQVARKVGVVVDAVVEWAQHRQQGVVAILQGCASVVVDGTRASVNGVVFHLHRNVLDDVTVEATLVYSLGVEYVVEYSPVQLVHDLRQRCSRSTTELHIGAYSVLVRNSKMGKQNISERPTCQYRLYADSN